MNVSTLRRMPYPKLTDLIGKAQAVAEEKRLEERAKLKAEIVDMVEAKGFSVAELVGSKRKTARKSAPPKYRNPADPKQTWNGIGRPPRWMRPNMRQSA